MTVTWSLTAGQAITRAYRILGNLEPPWNPSDDQMTQGIIAMNAMFKGWQADGINLWRQEQVSIAVPALSQSILITPKVQGVEEARWVVTPAPNLFERPLGYFSYVDYMTLPNKLSQTTSGPSVYMFDKQDTTSTLWLWPIPTNGGTLNATVARSVNDVTDPNEQTDVPNEWTEGVIYNLADRLMDDQGTASADPQTANRITQHAIAFYTKLLNFDRPTSVWIRPYGRSGRSRLYR